MHLKYYCERAFANFQTYMRLPYAHRTYKIAVTICIVVHVLITLHNAKNLLKTHIYDNLFLGIKRFPTITYTDLDFQKLQVQVCNFYF